MATKSQVFFRFFEKTVLFEQKILANQNIKTSFG
jgi:hypothetical protein